MSDLEINNKTDGDTAVFELKGIINEDSSFAVITKCEQKNIVVDFDGVYNINSCGVREWITALKDLGPDKTINYLKPRKLVVMQFNQVKGFIPNNCHVKNFYAPYFCDECDEGSEELIDAKENMSEAPIVKCSKCNAEMEFDALEDQYFLFLGKE